MKFDDVIFDIKKMIGVQIHSIRAGADITLTEVNTPEERLELKTSSDTRRSRPLVELRRVWERLCLERAVHVDSVLGGSGSSRNQPETILANLPYVEWLILNGKKHISFVGKSTHAVGTLKQMDSMAVESLKMQLKREREAKSQGALSQIVVVSGNLREHAVLFERCTGTPGKVVQQGIYEIFTKQQRVLLISKEMAPVCLSPGAYPVMAHKPPSGDVKKFNFLGHNYSLYRNDGVALLFCDE